MKRKEYSHRKSWFGCFVLIVREQYFNEVTMQHSEWGAWRDANTQNLIEYHMRMYAKE